MLELIRRDQERWNKLKSLALDSVTSPHSKRAGEGTARCIERGLSPGLARVGRFF
jgi:hypothetical protein